jgi:3-dehydroquinate synthase
MRSATELARRTGDLAPSDAETIQRVIATYGPIPLLEGVTAQQLVGRLAADKKTLHGKVHFVLPVKIGDVKIVSGVEDRAVIESIEAVLA